MHLVLCSVLSSTEARWSLFMISIYCPWRVLFAWLSRFEFLSWQEGQMTTNINHNDSYKKTDRWTRLLHVWILLDFLQAHDTIVHQSELFVVDIKFSSEYRRQHMNRSSASYSKASELLFEKSFWRSPLKIQHGWPDVLLTVPRARCISFRLDKTDYR